MNTTMYPHCNDTRPAKKQCKSEAQKNMSLLSAEERLKIVEVHGYQYYSSNNKSSMKKWRHSKTET